ncbi:hypothetical protein ABC733_22180 [Mangrovibacter sp. SLW1]
MESLAKYISVAVSSDERIIDQSCSIDEQAEVMVKNVRWQFPDGIVLNLYKETELHPSCEEACHSCFISWTVTAPEDKDIHPRHKTFNNDCQQKFWLKVALANQAYLHD